MLSRKMYCPLLCGSLFSNLKEHLIFCQNKHLLGKYYFKCPFNSNHILGKKLINMHIQYCPNKNNNKENLNNNNFEEDNFNKNKFSKISESKKEIKLKENKKFNSYNKEFNFNDINKLIFDNSIAKNLFPDEKYSVSTNKSDNSDFSDEKEKKISKSHKKKVSFGRMTKVVLFKNKKEKNNFKMKKKFKFNDSDDEYSIETYMKFL